MLMACVMVGNQYSMEFTSAFYATSTTGLFSILHPENPTLCLSLQHLDLMGADNSCHYFVG